MEAPTPPPDPDRPRRGRAKDSSQPIVPAPPASDTDPDQEAQSLAAPVTVTPPDPDPLVAELTVLKRRYDALRSAKQRLLLQALATCRSYAGGDKELGAKLYRDPPPELAAWLVPYSAAMAPLDVAIAEQEKLLTKLGKQLPVWDWAAPILGLSSRFLAMVVAEAGTGPGDYRTPSALWKRMGLAVIDGQRQRKVAGEGAIEQGYVGRRRALLWNIGESIIRKQVRKGGVAIGELGQLYLDRKAYEAERAERPIVAHNRAKRYVEKRLLRELWKAWRAATRPAAIGNTEPNGKPPPAETDPDRSAKDVADAVDITPADPDTDPPRPAGRRSKPKLGAPAGAD
jgi:hypothetical protein